MVVLGQLLRDTQRLAPLLPSDVTERLAERGLSPAGFARAAAIEFDRLADDAAWSTLISRLQGSVDPALACLEYMVRWKLAFEERTSHGHPVE